MWNEREIMRKGHKITEESPNTLKAGMISAQRHNHSVRIKSVSEKPLQNGEGDGGGASSALL